MFQFWNSTLYTAGPASVLMFLLLGSLSTLCVTLGVMFFPFQTISILSQEYYCFVKFHSNKESQRIVYEKIWHSCCMKQPRFSNLHFLEIILKWSGITPYLKDTLLNPFFERFFYFGKSGTVDAWNGWSQVNKPGSPKNAFIAQNSYIYWPIHQ